MEFAILGPLEVRDDGAQIELGRGKQRALVAVLLVHANAAVSSDRLIHELWGSDPPATAQAALHNYVSQLRKLLGPDRLETHPAGYRLSVLPGELDAERFETLLPQAPGEALALWRGPALAEFAFEPFAQNEIARLEELRLVGLQQRIDADLGAGAHAAIVGELEALVAEHPLREAFRAQLMLALYRSGRQAEALDVYQSTRRMLVDELGIEPSEELRALQRRMLAQDEQLAAPTKPPAPIVQREAVTPAAPRQVRKVVAVLSCTLEPARADVDPEAQGALLDRALPVVEHVVERHGGTVINHTGDKLTAAFGVPRAHEDDALRAVRAAAEIRLALQDEADLRFRLGVATGEIVVRGDVDLVGDVLRGAARLAGTASAGEILVDAETRKLAGPAIAAASAVDDVWRVERFEAEAPAVERHFETPLFGRDDELTELRRAFDRCVRDRTAFLFTLLGPAGIGKTRLAAEFATAVAGDARVLTGRCLPYGDGITYWPLREIVRQAFGPDPAAALREALAAEEHGDVAASTVSAVVGIDETSGLGEQTFWAIRTLVETLARAQPLVLIVEDIHWAEPTLLNLVEHLAERIRAVPVLLLCLARVELLDERPAWGGGKPNARSALLDPLPEHEARALVEHLVQPHAVDAGARARILDAAEGNPLFVEQLLARAAENGGSADVPGTIQALLAARLDRLGPGERAVIEAAAVIGKDFWREALAELLPDEAAETLDRHLDALVRKELIRPFRSTFFGGDDFRFRHMLIRDAAYRAVTKSVRADLHERFADWLEEKAGARASEYDEILGYHLEAAVRSRSELGDGERDAQLAARAGERLFAAGLRARDNGDIAAALKLYERAVALLPDDHASRPEALFRIGTAMRSAGRYDDAVPLIEKAIVAARAAGDRATEARAVLAQALTEAGRGVPGGMERMIAVAREVIEDCEQAGDEFGLAVAWRFRGWALAEIGSTREATDAYERSVEHARRSGDPSQLVESLDQLAQQIAAASLAIPERLARLEAVVAEVRERQPVMVPRVMKRAALLHARQRRFAEARAGCTLAFEALEGWGWGGSAITVLLDWGWVELLAGDYALAEEKLAASRARAHAGGATGLEGFATGGLAEVALAQGRLDDALELAADAERLLGERLGGRLAAISVRARALARSGETGEAELLMREVLAAVPPADRQLAAELSAEAAEVFALAGKRDEAREAAEAALAVFDEFGDLVLGGRTRAFLGELAPLR